MKLLLFELQADEIDR